MTETSTRSCFGCHSGAAGQKIVARFFTAPCFRLSLRRGQTKNHCPKFQRGLTSVHGIVAAIARALPCFSPRLDLGCRFGAAGLKSIARNFNAAQLRCMDLSRQPPGRCPLFHRGLASVVAPARPDWNPLPETSLRSCFGCRSGAAGRNLVDRNFTALLLRLSLRRGRAETR